MNKQIEEMAKDIADFELVDLDGNPHTLSEAFFPYDIESIAKQLYNASYRKASNIEKELADWKAIAKQYQKQFEDCYEEKEKIASEVAREIFAEIEEAIFAHGTKYAMKRLEELKKKYEVMDDES